MIDRLAPALFVHGIEIAFVVGMVALVAKVFARRRPHLAYALWLVALAKCFVPSMLPLPISPPTFELLSSDSERPRQERSGNRSEPEAPGVVVATDAHAHSDGAKNSEGRFNLLGVVLLAWAGGAAVILGLAVGRQLETRRFLRHTAEALPPDLAEKAERLKGTFGVGPQTQVLSTPTETGPATVGVLRPAVYLPSLLVERLQSRRVEAMIAHELAHVRRGDALVATLQMLAQVLWWFHPAVWWMNRQIVWRREECCDEEVVATLGGRRRDYAESLVDVLEAKRSSRPLIGFPGIRLSQVTRTRLEEIMKREKKNHRRTPWWCWGAALVAAAVVLPFGGNGSQADAFQLEGPKPSSSSYGSGKAIQIEKAKKTPRIIKYGDGKPDGKKSYGGTGMLVRFEMPEGATHCWAIRIHGSRYGSAKAPEENFEMNFLNEEMDEVIHTEEAPYKLFKRGTEKWVRVKFKEPIELPKVFWIALDFKAEQTKGVYVSFDKETKAERSKVGLAGDDPDKMEAPKTGGDWMVQVLLSKPGESSVR